MSVREKEIVERNPVAFVFIDENHKIVIWEQELNIHFINYSAWDFYPPLEMLV